MKFSRVLVVCAALLMLGAVPGFAQDAGGAGRGQSGTGAPGGGGGGSSRPGLTLTTTAFPDGGEIPAKYTMSVPNPVSPDLEWTNVPLNTASFVLILQDANTSSQRSTDTILHWLMFNIPGTLSKLPEGVPAGAALPDGSIQAKNLRGNPVYMGAGAPAVGPLHHYMFELYALDIKLDLGADATRADILKAINGHILGKGVLIGVFHL